MNSCQALAPQQRAQRHCGLGEKAEAASGSQRDHQVCGHILEGTVYASVLRLQQKAWISASWGVSENNRKAKFYAITRSGRKQLSKEAENWERIAGVMGRVLGLAAGR
jgi:hypothetical protein